MKNLQSLSLDKDYYRIGEKAVMTFSFTPSADSYPGSRQGRKTKVSDITLLASLKDGRGNLCAEQIEKVYGSDYSGSPTKLEAGIKSNCKDPTVTLSLTDQTGKLLDEKTFAIETQSKDKSSEKALIIFGIVILILLILYIVVSVAGKKKKDGVNLSSFIFLFIFSTIFTSGILISTPKAEAMLLAVPIDDIDPGGTGGGGGTPVTNPTTPVTGMHISVSLDKSTPYNPGEGMTITSNANYVTCSNQTRNLIITAHLSSDTSEEREIFNNNITGSSTISSAYSGFKAPEVAGSYDVVITVTAYYISPDVYQAVDNIEGLTISSEESFEFFKAQIANWVEIKKLLNYDIAMREILESYDLLELQQTLSSFNYPISTEYIHYDTTTSDFTGVYRLPFTVTAPTTATVNVTIKDESGNYVEGPVTKSVGQDVGIKWISSSNATGCDCVCKDPNNADEANNTINCGNNQGATSSCGSGVNSMGGITQTIYNVVRDTRFKVTCSP